MKTFGALVPVPSRPPKWTETIDGMPILDAFAGMIPDADFSGLLLS
jgi:hypothetical protein